MAKPDPLMALMSKEGSEIESGDVAANAENGPVGAPMSTPQVNEGAQAEATAKIALAMKLLSMSLEPFGSETKEGEALMDSISKIQKTFGVKLDEGDRLIPAELKMLMEAAGQQSPEMQAANQPPPPPAAMPAPMPMAA